MAWSCFSKEVLEYSQGPEKGDEISLRYLHIV